MSKCNKCLYHKMCPTEYFNSGCDRCASFEDVANCNDDFVPFSKHLDGKKSSQFGGE